MVLFPTLVLMLLQWTVSLFTVWVRLFALLCEGGHTFNWSPVCRTLTQVQALFNTHTHTHTHTHAHSTSSGLSPHLHLMCSVQTWCHSKHIYPLLWLDVHTDPPFSECTGLGHIWLLASTVKMLSYETSLHVAPWSKKHSMYRRMLSHPQHWWLESVCPCVTLLGDKTVFGDTWLLQVLCILLIRR